MKHALRLAALLVAAASLPTAFAADDAKKPAASAGHGHEHAHLDPPTAGVAVMQPTKGSEVGGTLTLTQMKGHVHIKGEITGLTPGKHGFHIHMFGDTRAPDGASAGGHFNPEGHKHGGPDDEKAHAGDLGNVEADENGTAKVDTKAKTELHFILGRSLVVHAGEDDLKTDPSGDSGGRVAVGIIGIAENKTNAKPGAKTDAKPAGKPAAAGKK